MYRGADTLATCEFCGADLTGRREGTRYCNVSCPSVARYRRHPDRGHRGVNPHRGRGKHLQRLHQGLRRAQGTTPEQGRARSAPLHPSRRHRGPDPRQGQGCAGRRHRLRSSTPPGAGRRRPRPSAPVTAAERGRERTGRPAFGAAWSLRSGSPRRLVLGCSNTRLVSRLVVESLASSAELGKHGVSSPETPIEVRRRRLLRGGAFVFHRDGSSALSRPSGSQAAEGCLNGLPWRS